MIVFADSSALVTLYADEPGRDHLRRVDHLVVAQIARVEVPAALWRKHRTGDLSSRSAALLVTRFEIDWFGNDQDAARFAVVGTTSRVLDDAARLTGVHGLRADDAVQLATALAVRAADPSTTRFAAYDRALRDSAAVEGLTLVP